MLVIWLFYFAFRLTQIDYTTGIVSAKIAGSAFGSFVISVVVVFIVFYAVKAVRMLQSKATALYK